MKAASAPGPQAPRNVGPGHAPHASAAVRARYQTPLGPLWFLQRPGYFRFMAREATSLFVAGYVIYLLVWLARLGRGAEAYEAWLETARRPWSVALHVITLAAALYHSITWFNLTPKIMPMHLGEDRVADVWAAVVMGYLPWLFVSGVILWGAMR